jgi:hypothetical protein
VRERERGAEKSPAALRIRGGERERRLSGWARVSTFIYCDRDMGQDGRLIGLVNINRGGSYK